jgi:hypothetical protein
MAKEEEYRETIQQYSWEELSDLWEAIKAGNTPDWGNGKAFEYLVLRAFQLEGAYVVWPYPVTIGELTRTETNGTAEQIDGFIHTVDGLACLVECKNYGKDKVNLEPIAKLRNQLLRRPSAVIGIVFSRSGFTDLASLLARFIAPQTILLWGGDEVEIALKNQWFCKGLTAKYRVCAQKGLPDYHISLGV